MPERCRSLFVGSHAARALLSSPESSLGEWEGSQRGGGRTRPGRVDDAALHSTATVWYESTAAPRFGAASIRILTPGGAGTGGSTALTDGCVEAGGAANIRTNPGGEDTAGRLADICSVLLSRAQTRRTKALVGARETILPSSAARCKYRPGDRRRR